MQRLANIRFDEARVLGHNQSVLRGLLLVVAVCVIVGVAAVPARASEGPVVAVLYFDNNTGDPKLDVLQKGFADMMITDLTAVPGVVVVERARLEEVLTELKLQRSAYFDEKTAVKIGQGLGARYAVAGSFASATPKMRIDVRMIDIATGKVVVTSKVTGPADEIFDLEQQLVQKFVKAMKRKFDPPALPKTKVPDVDTLLRYSRSVDQADRGNLQVAERSMGQVVTSAPSFALARIQRNQFKKRLAAARAHRESVIDTSEHALVRNARTFLDKNSVARLPLEKANHYLAYRIVYGESILRSLEQHLGGKKGLRVVKRGRERAAEKVMASYYANTQTLLAEMAAFEKAHGVPAARSRLPKDDESRAKTAGMGDSLSGDALRWQRKLAEFLLLGKCDVGVSARGFRVGPPLSELNSKYRKRGYALLEKAWAAAHARAKTTDNPRDAVDALMLHGEALILRGQVEAGIEKWQKILESYPKIFNYARVEANIEKQLGLRHDNDVKVKARYASGLKTCDDMSLRVGWSAVLYARTRIAGIQAIPQIVAEIEKSCSANPKAKQFWSYLYSHAALAAARYDDCEWFDGYMTRYLNAGGSQSSAAGYRKNYSSCP